MRANFEIVCSKCRNEEQLYELNDFNPICEKCIFDQFYETNFKNKKVKKKDIMEIFERMKDKIGTSAAF